MSIKQISVFLENKPGSLEEITTLLGEGGVDLLALSLADTANFGIFRAIASNSEKALSLVRARGYTANLTDVLAVAVPDGPGGLAGALRVLHGGGFFIEYLYSLVRRVNHKAVLIFRVEKTAEAETLLQSENFTLFAQEELSSI